MKSEYRKHTIAMALCFIMGGFSIVLCILLAYTAFWGVEIFGAPRHTNNSFDMNRSFERSFGQINPTTILTSPLSLFLLINGIILIGAGFSIWNLTREKEMKSAREKLTSILLLPEERAVIEELRKSKGTVTQSQLVKNTGLSKVKAHRVIRKLAAKGIIKKYPYGLTNKIVLEKDV